jgi:DMSO/TMAO reductase YedYZ heme-binding membrane subunit
LKQLLQNKVLNNWNLYWLISIPISIACALAMIRGDLSTGAGLLPLIEFSVYCAVPLIYLAFAASSLHGLFPSLFSRWLLRNRSIIGLCFATAMAWQLLSILWLVLVHTQFYLEEQYVLSDAIEGTVGYLLLLAMVLTSFKFGRRRLTPRQWKLLHKIGIYYIWAYIWSTYWWQVFSYPDPLPIDIIYYWAGFLAWGLRLGAWMKKNWQQPAVGHTV